MALDIEISLLEEYSSVEQALIDITGASKSQLKKYAFSKKFLNKKATPQMLLEIPIDLVNHLKISSLYTGERVPKFLDENEDIIALSKPAKIHTHPHCYSDSENLLSAFYQLGIGHYLEVNSDRYDRGLLYRLDYETSGLILYAKSKEVYEQIRTNYSDSALDKSYLAVVPKGVPEGEHEHSIRPTGSRGSKMTEAHTDGQMVQIKIKVIKSQSKYSLIEVKLKQGKRHQIRAQLSILGYPIVGDPLYGGDIYKRLMLHCYQYSIKYQDSLYTFKDEGIGELEDFLLSSHE